MLDKIKQWFNGLKKKFNCKRKKVHKADKRELYARILAAFMIFWTLASVFGFIGFARSCDNDRNVTAGAVSNTQFQTTPKTYAVIPAGTIFYTSSGQGIPLRFSSFLPYVSLRFPENSIYGYSKPVVYTFSIVNNSVLSDDSYMYSGMNVMYVETLVNIDNSNGDMYRFRTTNVFYLPLYGYAANSNTINISGSLLNINHLTYDSSGAVEYWNNVNYECLSSTIQIVSEPEYSFQEGYDLGYQVGYEAGESVGYIDGVDDSNTYTFSSLISSIVDVPIRAFSSLFNFEVLGINLASFFFSLLTICIVLLIVKFVF